MSLQKLIDDMESCMQTQGQSVMQHGEAVRDRLFDLIGLMRSGESKMEWKLPVG